jgi:hypothetical protein
MGKKLLYLFLFTIAGFQPLVAQTENAIRTGQNADAQPSTIQYLYEDALAEIKGMLEGKQTSSFKKAVFLTENAFLEGQVPYPAFEQIIQEATKLCQYIESVDSLIYTHKDRDEVRKNAAIFRYMTQALVLEDSLLTLPYRYDFEDFMGKDDWTKTLVTKLLVTHQGNCHSLPYLYKILADEMGAKAWLSLAPSHIYIKNQSQKISWYNTELTSATFPIDAWLMASGYITYESVVNRVYMDTLGVKQSLALCLVDLAQGYQRKQANYNPDFALKCVDLALQYYPQYINALLLKGDILRRLSINKAHQDPKTTQELIGICDKIYDLGYREMPESMYLEWLSGDKYKAPDSVRTQNTQKGNPFGYKKEVLTLSNGRYDEFQEKERLVKIGWVMYDTERKVISEYLQPNPEKIQISPELVSRFLSVDPIGREYPELTPYQFASNMPINSIDLDGLERLGVIKDVDKRKAVLTNIVNGKYDPLEDFKIQNKGNMWNYNKLVRVLRKAGEEKRMEMATGIFEQERNKGTNMKIDLGVAIAHNIDPSASDIHVDKSMVTGAKSDIGTRGKATTTTTTQSWTIIPSATQTLGPPNGDTGNIMLNTVTTQQIQLTLRVNNNGNPISGFQVSPVMGSDPINNQGSQVFNDPAVFNATNNTFVITVPQGTFGINYSLSTSNSSLNSTPPTVEVLQNTTTTTTKTKTYAIPQNDNYHGKKK